MRLSAPLAAFVAASLLLSTACAQTKQVAAAKAAPAVSAAPAVERPARASPPPRRSRPPPASRPRCARSATTAPAAGTIRGHFDEVAFKSKSFQMKVDGDVEVLTFDPATLKIVNAPDGADLEKVLKAIDKGVESRVEYVVDGAAREGDRPHAQAEAQGRRGEAGQDGRAREAGGAGAREGQVRPLRRAPRPEFAEGYIPTAESLPFPAFDKEKAKLPADKGTLVVFYCAGVTCALSPAARDAAEKLGYTNAKIYHEGLPVWSKANPMALEPKLLKEAWMDKAQPIVVLDARKTPTGGVIAGATAVADTSAAALGKVTKLKKLKPPVVVYDADGAGNAVAVAKALVAAGQPAMVLTGGLAAWKGAGYPLSPGAPAAEVAFTPKPKAGELSVEEFKKLVAAPSSGVVLLDVRNADELADGAFPGSVNIPAWQLSSRTAELQRTRRS